MTGEPNNTSTSDINGVMRIDKNAVSRAEYASMPKPNIPLMACSKLINKALKNNVSRRLSTNSDLDASNDSGTTANSIEKLDRLPVINTEITD